MDFNTDPTDKEKYEIMLDDLINELQAIKESGKHVPIFCFIRNMNKENAGDIHALKANYKFMEHTTKSLIQTIEEFIKK